jgi:hypothetical protein
MFHLTVRRLVLLPQFATEFITEYINYLFRKANIKLWSMYTVRPTVDANRFGSLILTIIESVVC